jgi:CRP/FNR family nitrogen fixation transcriptional regulator
MILIIIKPLAKGNANMSALQHAAQIDTTKISARSPLPWPVIEGGKARTEGEDALLALQRIGSTLRFKRNETIFAEGDRSGQVYKVTSGAVRTCRVLMDGRRQIVDFFLPGDFFGLDWQDVHSFSAEAIADAVIVSYPRNQIERLGETIPGVQKRLMAILCKGLALTQDHLVMLGRQTAIEKLAWFLVRKAERLHADDRPLELPMSRLDIADYLGLTIETVSRGLGELKRHRHIAIASGHRIAIRNIEELRSLANGETGD